MLRLAGVVVAVGFALVAPALGMRPVHAVVIAALIYVGVVCVLRTRAKGRPARGGSDEDATSRRLDR